MRFELTILLVCNQFPWTSRAPYYKIIRLVKLVDEFDNGVNEELRYPTIVVTRLGASFTLHLP